MKNRACMCRYAAAARCVPKSRQDCYRAAAAGGGRNGSVALTAFREVENGLTNEELLAQRVQFD